jgi:LVIVD repeat-containing protein
MVRLLVRCAFAALAVGSLAVGTGRADPRPGREAESKNMKLVGFDDLQARSAYQPIVHEQGGRSIAYVGHHGGQALNPLTGVVEKNGTSVVDVTDPRHPRYLFHIPGPSGAGEAGGAQMVRACSAKELPNANLNGDPARSKHYLLRATANSHEVYDVTDPAKPTLVTTVVANLRNTHKSWWQCDTGIAYLVSDGTDLVHATPSFPNWRANRMTQIFDLSNPADPKFIRNYGLVGQQPGSTGPIPQTVHGMIELGDRVYFGHGTGSNGILQIVDRTKLLDPTRCATPPSANFATNPTEADLLCSQLGRLDTSPTMGAHTVFPVIQQPVPDFAASPNAVRDFIILVNEAGGNRCSDNRQMTYVVDISTPSKPMPVASFHVPAASGDFCSRGGRFGSHSSNESFTSVFYGKLVFVSWFNAGVRAIDIREPFSPREVGFFIPATTANTDPRPEGCKLGVDAVCDVVIQTNNVEVDGRGLVYIVDRANTGMHILRLTGQAAEIAGLSSD